MPRRAVCSSVCRRIDWVVLERSKHYRYWSGDKSCFPDEFSHNLLARASSRSRTSCTTPRKRRTNPVGCTSCRCTSVVTYGASSSGSARITRPAATSSSALTGLTTATPTPHTTSAHAVTQPILRRIVRRPAQRHRDTDARNQILPDQ